jgi:hypothetical protein
VTILDGRVRGSRWTEQLRESARREAPRSGGRDESVTEAERAVVLEGKKRLHLPGEGVLAVRPEAHDLVLVLVHAEAEVRRHERIEEPERVRETDLADGNDPFCAR